MSEIKKIITDHEITLSNRNKMSLTGVTDVISFNDDRVDLKTNMGTLVIKGKGLNINKLNTDSGNLDVTGEVQLLEYVNRRDKGTGIFGGLFK